MNKKKGKIRRNQENDDYENIKELIILQHHVFLFVVFVNLASIYDLRNQ